MSDVPPSSIRMFDSAHDMVFHGSTFISNTTTHMLGKQGSASLILPSDASDLDRTLLTGLDKLLAYSMRGAFHDSSDRYPPPRCHYDSRQELRKTITDWATGLSEASKKLLLWMHGPFGVGKSAVAQNSAEALAGLMKLAASLFFSRPNHRNDPNRIFTSITYQLVLRCPPLGNILDRIIISNPTILTAALPIQFQELIVKPLLQLTQMTSMDGWTIILDGFDEIDGIDVQCDIIDIIATSIHDRTTPFRWFIISRPEAHIQRAMRARNVTPLIHTLHLPLSPENDHEILTFLMKELEKIGEKHGLPPSWCTEVELAILVKLVGGLWIYVSTITRFIGDAKSFGPQPQLRLVLSLAEKQTRPLAQNPLEAMDQFYDLIMEQIPPHVLLTARKILLLESFVGGALGLTCIQFEIFAIANILQLSVEEFLAACSFLQSVLLITNNQDHPSHIQFYHASFMDYARDPRRSKKFCIFGDILESLRLQVTEQVNSVHSCSAGGSLNLNFTSWDSIDPQDETKTRSRDTIVYYTMIYVMFGLCSYEACAVSPSTAAVLQKVAFSYIPRFASGSRFGHMTVRSNFLRDNLPPEYRDKIIRRSTNPLHLNKEPGHRGNKHAFILGTAPNELICWPNQYDENRLDIDFNGGYLLYETETRVTPDTEEVTASEPERARRRQWRWFSKSSHPTISRSQKGYR
ncbi:hypothetical protein NP233_g9056 [Leucocoprinus birnbaumii]|uniref:Nephrocystin 3-like N-terminal domain-containing protein n=1 Tax=Leucocoprinus birnbaumii TaxID=56174 RepID=A0AAD5YT64_9AGAR|nr:hypothetical protein NP233_g9056 [Leucocoprinus birnbaumii]